MLCSFNIVWMCAAVGYAFASERIDRLKKLGLSQDEISQILQASDAASYASAKIENTSGDVSLFLDGHHDETKTRNPTLYPTLDPTTYPTFGPTLNPASSTPTSSNPTPMPSNNPSNYSLVQPLSHNSKKPFSFTLSQFNTMASFSTKYPRLNETNMTATNEKQEKNSNKSTRGSFILLILLFGILAFIGNVWFVLNLLNDAGTHPDDSDQKNAQTNVSESFPLLHADDLTKIISLNIEAFQELNHAQKQQIIQSLSAENLDFLIRNNNLNEQCDATDITIKMPKNVTKLDHSEDADTSDHTSTDTVETNLRNL